MFIKFFYPLWFLKPCLSIMRIIKSAQQHLFCLTLRQSVINSLLFGIAISIIHNIEPVFSQRDMCPKVCICNEENLEVRCNQPFNAYGLPHTLNPMTKRIIVNHAQTTHVTTSDLSNYLQLELLDLAHNKLTIIDFDYIKSNANLLSLNISHNNIIDLKDSAVTVAIEKAGNNDSNFDEQEAFRSLKKTKINVIELSLSHNQLTAIKNYTFIRWHQLNHLDLSYNLIVALESNSLVGLTRLEYINLKFNQLAQIPSLPFLGTTRSLTTVFSPEVTDSPIRTVDLSNNALVTIGANSFKLMGKIQELYLENASIQMIEKESFDGLAGLYVLSLTGNALTEVPSESFKYLPTLKLIKLSSNQITNLRARAFENLKSLEELQINEGELTHVEPGAFNGLNNLRRLEMSQNQNLNKLEPGTFDQLNSLHYLSLYSNSLKTVANSSSIVKSPLTIVDLRNNRLYCDCDLKWLTKWMIAFNETLRNFNPDGHMPIFHQDLPALMLDASLTAELLNLTCAGPPALVGRLVSELPDNKLECLTPVSDLNVHIGFLSLILMTLVLTTVCTVNLCRNDKRLMGILKENLAQSRISMMLPTYAAQGTARFEDDSKAETHFSTDYEPVDYWPVYTIPNCHVEDARPSQCTYNN